MLAAVRLLRTSRTATGSPRPELSVALRILHAAYSHHALAANVARIRDEVGRGGIRRVVIDSLAEMVFASRESQRYPAYARNLIGLLRNAGVTLLVTSETTLLGPTPEPANGIMFLFHNVILLRYIELANATGRALNVVKMRNSDHSKQLFRLDIGPQGLTVGAPLESTTGVLGWNVLRVSGEGG